MKIWKVAAALIVLIVLALRVVSSAEPPDLFDLAQLGLRVAKAEVVREIRHTDPDHLYGTKLSAPSGYRLVVVTLKGRASKPCRIYLTSYEFVAVYHKDGKVSLMPAAAIARDIHWSVFYRTGLQQVDFACKRGPITLKVVVPLPLAVKSFRLRYPTLARGEAVIK